MTATVRESIDNIPNGSRRVRVQTVNANSAAKKCGIKLDRGDFCETESAVYANLEHDPEKWEPVFRKDHAPSRKAGAG
jgi:hypothetical protein